MQNHDGPAKEAAVLGQKYAYATASLILGLLCFVNLAGLEKAVVAIVFGVLALVSDAARRARTLRGVDRVLSGLITIFPRISPSPSSTASTATR